MALLQYLRLLRLTVQADIRISYKTGSVRRAINNI